MADYKTRMATARQKMLAKINAEFAKLNIPDTNITVPKNPEVANMDKSLDNYSNIPKHETAQLNSMKSKTIDINPFSDTPTLKMPTSTESEMNLGDKIGIYSGLMSSLMNLGATIASKDTNKMENPFRDYAKRALDKYQEINSNIDAARTLAKEDKILAENTQREKNRLSSRGLNTNRALDLSTFIAGLGADRKIDSDYFNRIAGVQQQEAQTMLKQDEVVMGAEERTIDKEQANKDNFLSNLSSNITDLGIVGESIGKTLNTELENEIKANTALSGKYGTNDEYADQLGILDLLKKAGYTITKE
jgi:hypothetical protein